jgi:NAD(P)-dependent dehydrogenase (short-subunit alcohol dehydrogenase family)
MLINEGNLLQNSLKGDVAVVTGAGSGIGYETARALIWLGAKVIIAEVNEENGRGATENLQKEFGAGKAFFVKTDVGNDKDIETLTKQAIAKWKKVDIIVNNTTVLPTGTVKDTPIDSWDFSYRMNLRGPALLAQTFLPDMIKRKHGVFVCTSSSGAAPFTGAYEVFKTAQVKLANTIATEVKDTGVYAFTIESGIVKTQSFVEGGSQVASLMGITLEQLLSMNKAVVISPEAAGAGFAGAVALASKYHGQEINALQVLRTIGINVAGKEGEEIKAKTVANESTSALYKQVMKTYAERSYDWKHHNFLQKAWLAKEFKQNTDMSIDEMHNTLITLGKCLEMKASTGEFIEPLKKLAAYYEYQKEVLKSYAQFSKKQETTLEVIAGWTREVNDLIEALSG